MRPPADGVTDFVMVRVVVFEPYTVVVNVDGCEYGCLWLTAPTANPLNAATIITITIKIERMRLMVLEVSKVFNRDSVDKKYFKLPNK